MAYSACIATILRTYYNWKFFKSEDISYNLVFMGFWADAEINIGMATCCSPVLPKFFQHFGPWMRSPLSCKYKGRLPSRTRPLLCAPTMKSNERILEGQSDITKRTWEMDKGCSQANSENGRLHATEGYFALNDDERGITVPSNTYTAKEDSASYMNGIATIRDHLERCR